MSSTRLSCMRFLFVYSWFQFMTFDDVEDFGLVFEHLNKRNSCWILLFLWWVHYTLQWESFILYVRKISEKLNFSWVNKNVRVRIRVRKASFLERKVRKVSFLESFSYVLNEWMIPYHSVFMIKYTGPPNTPVASFSLSLIFYKLKPLNFFVN